MTFHVGKGIVPDRCFHLPVQVLKDRLARLHDFLAARRHRQKLSAGVIRIVCSVDVALLFQRGDRLGGCLLTDPGAIPKLCRIHCPVRDGAQREIMYRTEIRITTARKLCRRRIGKAAEGREQQEGEVGTFARHFFFYTPRAQNDKPVSGWA